MPTIPSATTTIDDNAGLPATGVDLLTVIAPVATSADAVPRVFGNAAALLAQHSYAPGVDYCAAHIRRTKKPVLFVGIPIATAGVVGRQNTSGNTGTSVVSVAAGGNGALEEVDGVVTVITGGTIGTDQIMLGLSLDGGTTTKRVRLGTASSYAIPNVGQTLSFAAGTLVAGDTVLTWHSTAPMWDSTGLSDARDALAMQQKKSRSWHVIGDLTAKADADTITTEANGYATENDRFTLARAAVRDRLPLAAKSKTLVRMTGNPNVTFLEVGATGDTITRSAGSFVTDGFAVNDLITVSGSGSNNFTGALITAVTATVLTLDTQDLVNEGPVGNVTITGTPRLVFAEVGATGDTITRSRGSWLDDGFRVGDKLTVSGTASNNITGAAGITAVTATVLTLDTDDLTAETIGSYSVTITAGETKAQWAASIDSVYAAVDAQKRIDLAAGRGRTLSPVLGYRLRRPASWHASWREYAHDVHIPTFRKSDGPLDDCDLNDTDGNLAEYDERVDGALLAARFTCLRTWANGPAGAFVALSLTRDTEGSLLSRTHNMHVANLACSIVQAATENAIGEVLELNDDGTATEDALSIIEGRINAQLEIALLQSGPEGPRASNAVWSANRDDVLNVPGATLNGTLALELNGTLEHINTTVKVDTAG